MIVTILNTATAEQLDAARHWVSAQLHIPASDISLVVAVAYVCRHFEQGTYSGWDGWVEMRGADER